MEANLSQNVTTLVDEVLLPQNISEQVHNTFSTIRPLAFDMSIHTLSWHATCFINSGIVINPSLSDGPQK